VTSVLDICQWLAGTRIGTQIRESDNLFSLIETVHVLAIVLTAGTIAVVDLRILGVTLHRYPIEHVLGTVVRITWFGFFIMASSGLLLFWSEADKLYYNAAFRLKLLLLSLAGVNQWVFMMARDGDSTRTNAAGSISWSAKWAAALSLGLWAGIIVLGRAIAYL
jgi:hypothetical protein